MKIKNPASRVFYFQSIRAVDIGTMDNAKMRSTVLLFYCSALSPGPAVPLFSFFIAPVFPFP